MANMAEGFSRQSRKKFAQFLYAAKGSAAEIQSYIYVPWTSTVQRKSYSMRFMTKPTKLPV
jgi:four helix bundle protein